LKMDIYFCPFLLFWMRNLQKHHLKHNAVKPEKKGKNWLHKK
jgi:hypothetical protein